MIPTTENSNKVKITEHVKESKCIGVYWEENGE